MAGSERFLEPVGGDQGELGGEGDDDGGGGPLQVRLWGGSRAGRGAGVGLAGIVLGEEGRPTPGRGRVQGRGGGAQDGGVSPQQGRGGLAPRQAAGAGVALSPCRRVTPPPWASPCPCCGLMPPSWGRVQVCPEGLAVVDWGKAGVDPGAAVPRSQWDWRPGRDAARPVERGGRQHGVAQ